MKIFEQIPHTADIQIRVYAKTLPELFAHAVVGMFQVIKPHAPGCSVERDMLVCPSLPEKHTVVIEDAVDLESLIVDFLSECLYLSDVHNEAYLDAEVHCMDTQKLKATLHGIKITGFEVVEIKAVTYHNLKIVKNEAGWQADIVFDI